MILEHLRVDSIPDEYILNRYSRGANLKPTFERADFRTVPYYGSSIAYNHNEVLQFCFRLARAASKSDEQLVRTKVGLKELIDQVEAMGCSTAGTDSEEGDIPPFSNLEPTVDKIFKQTERTKHLSEQNSREILPPPMSKTKGSGSKSGSKGKTHATHDKNLYDERFEPGERKCGVCGLKQKHNARNCPQLDDKPNVGPAAAMGNADGENSTKGKRKRGRICGVCRQFATGHNALSCPQREDKLQHLKQKSTNKKNK